MTMGSKSRALAGVVFALTSISCVRAEQVLVAKLVDDIVGSDLSAGGDCVTGCTREVHAVAHVAGTPQTTACELQTVTPFDTSTEKPGLLRASIYCEDVTGALIEQGTGPCQFDICVDFQWIDGQGEDEGQLIYDVVIVRDKKPRAAHTVYVDLSVAIDPTAPQAEVDSCAKAGTCAVKVCTAPTAYTAEILLTDSYGDGWVGGVPGYYNLWTLSQVGYETAVTRGTLADNHDSATVTECLADGDYVFNTTATSAFSADMGWKICNEYGTAGEGLEFSVENGRCTSPNKIAKAEAEEADDAEYSYCTLPAPTSEEDYRTSTCTTLSSGLKIDGVAMYYDERCENADYEGCGARSISGCRLCFVDKELWKERFPKSRVPDWEMCPCCVASILGTECATATGGGGTDKGVIIGVSVGIVGVIAIACCLSCAFGSTIVRSVRRLTKKKNHDIEMDLDMGAAAAFPDSPGNGHGGHTNRGARVASGHFPIPRFDSIRGRFDSGIFASTTTGGGNYSSQNIGARGAATSALDDGKAHLKDSSIASTATALSTPSGSGSRSSPNGPRSTVLDRGLVAKGFTTSDVGRPVSGAINETHEERTGTVGQRASGWGAAMSGEYPDLDGADPYAGENTLMVETGTHSRRGSQSGF